MKRLDLIIECLEAWKECSPQYWDGNDDLALSYARELRELKPVAYWNKAGYESGADDEDFIYPEARQHLIKANRNADYWSIPLFALGQSNEP